MKTNNITDVTKILILAASTIITCLIVAIGMNMARDAKTLSNTATSQMSELNDDISNSDIKMYDGSYVTGSEVVNFIKKQLGDYAASQTAPIYVYVKTVSENTYDNGNNIANIKNFSHNMYIKPTSSFLGKVVKNINNVIIGVNFIQQ